MKKLVKPIDWTRVVQQMAADKQRIEEAIESGTSIPPDIRLMHPLTSEGTTPPASGWEAFQE